MSMRLLIAMPSGVYRRDLVTFFASKADVDVAGEVETSEELETQLRSKSVDFVVAHQALITDIARLPCGKFVLLVRMLDEGQLQAAIAQAVRGYFLDSGPQYLIARAVVLPPGQCLFGPLVASWIAGLLREKKKASSEQRSLTNREREVLTLKEQHFTNRDIADRLYITEATVKKHVEHIHRKGSLKLQK